MAKLKKEFDKFYYYENSVQNAGNEVDFMQAEFVKLRKKKAKVLREDFCGTALISYHWVKQHKLNKAYAVDLDFSPIKYGQINHGAKLKESSHRLNYLNDNVLTVKTEAPDILCAFNFSYFIFKERSILLNYFKKVKNDLAGNGVFFLDLFGGPESQVENVDVLKFPMFQYFWECKSFNPINQHCEFAIHFKLKNQKKRKDVFTYDWRLWTFPELADLLMEAGFAQVINYWEGDDLKKKTGNGIFTPTKKAENCPAWVGYIVALK